MAGLAAPPLGIAAPPSRWGEPGFGGSPLQLPRHRRLRRVCSAGDPTSAPRASLCALRTAGEVPLAGRRGKKESTFVFVFFLNWAVSQACRRLIFGGQGWERGLARTLRAQRPAPGPPSRAAPEAPPPLPFPQPGRRCSPRAETILSPTPASPYINTLCLHRCPAGAVDAPGPAAVSTGRPPALRREAGRSNLAGGARGSPGSGGDWRSRPGRHTGAGEGSGWREAGPDGGVRGGQGRREARAGEV